LESYRHLNLFSNENGSLVFVDLCKSLHDAICPSVVNKIRESKSHSIGVFPKAEASAKLFFGNLFKENKNTMLKLPQTIKQKMSNSPILLHFMDVLEHTISSSYNSFVRELAKSILNFLFYNHMKSQDTSSESWLEIIVALGRGARFKSDVIDRYAYEIAAVEASLRIKAGRLWNRLVIDSLLNSFGKAITKRFPAKYHENTELQKARLLVMVENKLGRSDSLRRRLITIERRGKDVFPMKR